MAQSALGLTDSVESTSATLRTFLQPTPLDPGWSNDTADNEQGDSIHLDREDAHKSPMPLPRFSRAFSMPLPSQLGHLRRPQRPIHSAQSDAGLPNLPTATSNSDEVAMELADSVQMAVQTLLQISPPHLLDPAKEQLAGCSLQVPTPSISALLTSMKMLNYLARSIAPFTPASPDGSPCIPEDEFDAGELLQSVGDALSGVAAEAGVDLVIFHSDPSLRDLTIRADECGIAYALSHVARQMLTTASRGDVLELGLRLSPGSLVTSPRKVEQDGTMTLIFEFLHRTLPVSDQEEAATELTLPPNLQTSTLGNLLKSLRAELRVDPTARGPFLHRKYDFVSHVKPGNQVLAVHVHSKEEETVRQPFPDLRLAREPSIGELLEFVTTLKGQKATFHASTKSSFAHYLTVYLTGWGMDVTHLPSDSGLSTPPSTDNPAPLSDPEPGPLASIKLQSAIDLPKTNGDNAPLMLVAPFTIIDDDIKVLKSKLSELQIPLFQTLQEGRLKRPSLAAHHRPKSSSLVRRATTPVAEITKPSFSSVIVYFTSLSRYREVKDVVQTIVMPKMGRGPEIIVIPKPAGVRRFLTALYTAVTKPMVDPVFFSPIATSPMSPSGLTVPPFFTPTVQSPRPVVSPLPSNDQAQESMTTPFSSGTLTPVQNMPASPISSGGYFDRESKKMAGSASSGLFVKSPDGRTGIFFQPLALRGDPSDRDPEKAEAHTKPSEPRASQGVPGKSMPANSSPGVAADATVLPHDGSPVSPSSLSNPPLTLSVHVSPPSRQAPLSLPSVDPSSLIGDPVFDRGPVVVKPTKPAKASIVGAKVKKQTDVVVPPISVLIVEDNSIQRTILSTFMKNKQIAYGIAENGQEAVERWSTGNYHLVLMDIQMPVMDGIEATRRIRELEASRHRALSVLTPLSEGVQTPTSTTSNDSHQPSTPFHSSVIIVALTAQFSPQDRVAALAAGCNDFLSKPVKLQWLERKIIEWGSIKALQMWADPEVEPSLRKRQQASAQVVANNLRIVRPANKMNPIQNGASLSS